MSEIQSLVEQSLDNTVSKPLTDLQGGYHLVQYLARSGLSFYPWWSPLRDIQLCNFWKQVDYLSGAIYTMESKMSAIPVRVQARDQSIKEHVIEAERETERLLIGAEFGNGWAAFFEKFVESLITQDNGTFAEIIGAGQPDGPIIGRPITVRTLDPASCQRTGDPIYPIIYHDMNGKLYKMHFTRVMFKAQMESTIAQMFGVGFCLQRDAVVLMADGSYKRIVDIVTQKDEGPVMSLDISGVLVPKRITKWYKNKRGDRNLVNIRGELFQLNQGKCQKNAWVTEDHPILTPDGWISAGELETGDNIISSCPAPNRKQMEFIIGTLLGDGSSPSKGKRACLSFGQCIAQKEWFDLKRSVLEKDFGFKARVGMGKLKYKGITSYHESINGATKSHAAFNHIRDAFYKNGRKVIPFDLLDKYFSPLLLATWYMDDGNICNREPNDRNRQPHARLSTNGFTIDEVESLVELLNNRGYMSTVISARGNPNQRNIRFSVSGSKKLFDDIAPYIPSCTRYKLPHNSSPFDSSLWNLGDAIRLIDKAIVKHEWDKMNGSGYPYSQPESVYCIDVEDTHNFVCDGIVVHNCSISRAINTSQTLLDILIYKQEKLGSRPRRAILTVGGGLDPEDLAEAFRLVEGIEDSQSLSRYSKIAVVGDSSLPEAKIELTDISSLPDGFEERDNIELGMAVISMAFGMDARELFPAIQSGATRADALIQHLKQRGRGPGQIIQMTELMFGAKYLPPHLKLVFDFQDDEEDRQSAETKEIRARRWATSIKDTSMDKHTARAQMVETGDLERGQFERLELEDGRLTDGTSVLALFYSEDEKINKYLKLPVDNPIDIETNKWENIKDAVNENIVNALTIIVNSSNPEERWNAQKALAALRELGELYGVEDILDTKPNDDLSEVEEGITKPDPRRRKVDLKRPQQPPLDSDELEPDRDEERIKEAGEIPARPF